MSRILVVDDEPTLVETIRYNLKREGHEVVTATDGLLAIEAARREQPDLVILDLMLPKLDGFEVCRAIRRSQNVPILMLSAKDEEVDKVVGLELGADDYVTKPFSMRELLARVRAMLRRGQMLREEALNAQDAPSYRSGDLEVDVRQHRVFLRGSEVSLKPKEFDLLAFLVRNAGQAFTRDTLLQHVWGYDYVGDTRTVDVHIRGLREKVEVDPSEPTRLETVRGVGYRFAG
jgi:two-component system OmpR family response regulator